jgi:hypothetical protein
MKKPSRQLVLALSGAVIIGIAGAWLAGYTVWQAGAHPPPPYLVDGLKDIHDSKILFNPPREMEQGKTDRIEARISYQDVGDAIAKGLKGRGEPNVETIQVGQSMSVTLSGDKFDIKKYGSDLQVIAGRPFAQWEWDVTPLEYGDLTLHLKAVINVGGAAYDIPVIDRLIKVKVNPPYIAAQAARNEKIWNIVFGSGILVVVGGVVASIITWWWKRRKDRKDKDNPSGPKPWETS